MRWRKILRLSLIIYFFAFYSVQSVFGLNTGQTSGVLLKLPVSAQSGALADIAVVYDNPLSVLKNPALMSDRNQVMFSFSNWILDSKFGIGGFIYKYKSYNLGLIAENLNYGGFVEQKEDANGLYAGEGGSMSAYSNLFALTLGHELQAGLKVGAGLKFFMLNLYTNGSGLVPLFTFGAYKRLWSTLFLGLALDNVSFNKRLKVYKDEVMLPMSLRLGMSYKNINIANVKGFYVNLYSGIEGYIDRTPVAKLGVQMNYRSVYCMFGLSNKYDYMIPLSFGLGARYKNLNIAFSYLPSVYDRIWLGSMNIGF